MKKLLLLSLLGIACMDQASAQFTTVDVKDSISTNTTWTNDKQYLLKGYVYVTNGTTLTIDSGVIIRGDKNTKGALIVERGAKIYANGTKGAPIVFTSKAMQSNRSYGDWGGIIICGKAPTNWTAGEAQVEGGPRSLYGGTDPNDNSGKLSYVRIEYAGIAFSPNNEVNGLTLAGVGAGTQIDHIQVSYCGDDSYEWFGGTVNGKHLISLATWDDDFDTDAGYSGRNQFVVALRDPYAADISGSKAFESDSYLAGTHTGIGDTSKATKCIFSNATLIGPMVNPTSTAYDNLQHIAGVHIRRGSGLSLVNSVIAGFPASLLIDESSASYGSTSANIGNTMLQFRNNIIAGSATNSTPANKDVIYVKDGARNLTPTNAYADTATGTPFAPFTGPLGFINANGNQRFASFTNGVRLKNPFNLNNPDFTPTSTSPISYNSRTLPAYMTPGGSDPFANGKVYPFNPTKPINTDTSGMFANYNAPSMVPDFTNSKGNDAFFTKVNYVGAFAGTQTTSDNWMEGWSNFDPQNTNYEFVNTAVANLNRGNIASVAVFPNPAQQVAYLSFEVKETSSVRVVLTDLSGRAIQNVYNGQKVNGAQNMSIDLNNLSSGLYIVNIVTEHEHKSVKLSVAK